MTEDEQDLPECGWCGDPIEGEPVYDETQVWWLGRANATPFHSVDHMEEAAEAQSHRRTHNFYAG